jgi:hypothetical protein
MKLTPNPPTHLILEQPLTFLKKVRYVGVENFKFFKRTRQESDWQCLSKNGNKKFMVGTQVFFFAINP